MGNRPQRIHLATGNTHKVREMQALADESGLPIEIVAVENMPAVVEDSGTFVGNARKKAQALKTILPFEAWVLADDSGLCVDALDGAPGVESAYYAGPAGDARANLAKLVQAMSEVPDGRRGAHFICVLVLLGPEGQRKVFEGRCGGRLQREPIGGTGFGYDPLFVPAGFEQTYAELGDETKNKISHRARAFADLARWLKGSEF